MLYSCSLLREDPPLSCPATHLPAVLDKWRGVPRAAALRVCPLAVRLPWHEFRCVKRASFDPAGPPLDPAKVRQMGLVYSRFEFNGLPNPFFAPGEFRLLIDGGVRAYKEPRPQFVMVRQPPTPSPFSSFNPLPRRSLHRALSCRLVPIPVGWYITGLYRQSVNNIIWEVLHCQQVDNSKPLTSMKELRVRCRHSQHKCF